MAEHCPVCDAMTVGSEASCRQCSTPLLGHLPSPSRRLNGLARVRRLVLLNAMWALPPAAMMAVPETAPAGACFLLGAGLLLVLGGRGARYPAAVRLGVAQCIAPLIWVPFFWPLNGNPAAVMLGAPVMLAGAIGLFIASLCAWRDHPARQLRITCDHCGYCLNGLVEPRCPECGHAFDPGRLG
jgi:hypothetical protein